MDELSNDVVTYDAEDQIFVLTLSGNIDEHRLDKSVRFLRNSLDSHLGKDSVIKLLIDFRETAWDSEKTHVMTRQVLQTHLKKFHGYRYFFALLVNTHDWQSSDHEAHFTKEREALNWLRSKQSTE